MKLLICLLLIPLSSWAQQKPSQSEFGANLPALPIGSNDLIAVSIYDAPEFTRTVRVGADGNIRLPMLKKHVHAAGLLPSDLENALAEALRAEELIVDPFVTVTVVEYHSRPISVAGEVKNPITFQAIGEVTLLDALARANGLTTSAGAEILVSKSQDGGDGTNSTLIQRIPVKGLIDAADPALNVKLHGGEEIRVPEVGKIYVLGNVKRPGAYAFRDAADTTVMKTLALAEGLMPYAAKQAYIYRAQDGGSKNEIPIELKQMLDRKSPDVSLQANDILYVPDNKSRRTTMAALERALAFGVSTISGVLIYSTLR